MVTKSDRKWHGEHWVWLRRSDFRYQVHDRWTTDLYGNVEGELLNRLHQHRQVFMQSDSRRYGVNLTTSR
jgi:hypothetical protein